MFAVAIYFFFARDAEPSMPVSGLRIIALILPFVVIVRILHSGLTGRFDKANSFKGKDN